MLCPSRGGPTETIAPRLRTALVSPCSMPLRSTTPTELVVCVSVCACLFGPRSVAYSQCKCSFWWPRCSENLVRRRSLTLSATQQRACWTTCPNNAEGRNMKELTWSHNNQLFCCIFKICCHGCGQWPQRLWRPQSQRQPHPPRLTLCSCCPSPWMGGCCGLGLPPSSLTSGG